MPGIAFALFYQALNAQFTGNMATACELHERCAAMCGELGFASLRARALQLLGIRLFSVLRRGRHVMVVTGAGPEGVPAGPVLEPYRELLEVVTCSPGGAPAFRRGRTASIFLVRPDGYIAARGRPGRLEAVLGYLKELSGESAIHSELTRDPRDRLGSGGHSLQA